MLQAFIGGYVTAVYICGWNTFKGNQWTAWGLFFWVFSPLSVPAFYLMLFLTY